jgi:MerR family regulatory protein
MTVTARAVASPAKRQDSWSLVRGDYLIPFPEAARRLGRSPDTLRLWHDEGHMPAVITPGGQWSTYASFISAVLASARPKQPGSIEEIARHWFAAHAPEAVA